jgi:hypothetical protein
MAGPPATPAKNPYEENREYFARVQHQLHGPFFWAPKPNAADALQSATLFQPLLQTWAAGLAQASLYSNYLVAGYTSVEAAQAVRDTMAEQRGGKFTRLERLFTMYHTFLQWWTCEAPELEPTLENGRLAWSCAAPRDRPKYKEGRTEPAMGEEDVYVRDARDRVASSVAETRWLQLAVNKVAPLSHGRPSVRRWSFELASALKDLHRLSGANMRAPIIVINVGHPRRINSREPVPADWSPYEATENPM